MSVNFYDGSGLCVGFDMHNGIHDKPLPFVTVLPNFQYWFCTYYKQTSTVTSEGWKMIQDGCDWYFVPHVPIPPNNPLALPKLPGIIFDASSKAFMSVHSVTGEGDPLATALWGAAGLNADCWEWGLALPTGAVLQLNSVKTSPTAGDYVGAFAGLALDNVIGAVVEKLLDQKNPLMQAAVKHLLRRFPDIAKALGIEGDVVNWVTDTPAEFKKFIQEKVDG